VTSSEAVVVRNGGGRVTPEVINSGLVQTILPHAYPAGNRHAGASPASSAELLTVE
jgi:hypothetical protein